MAVSRLDSHGANIRAINAAKAVGRIARIDSMMSRLATISQNDELAGAMLDRVMAADAVLGQKVPLAVGAFCADSKQALPGSLAEACRTLGYDTVRKIIQIVGIASVYAELALRCDLSAEKLTQQAVAVATGAEYLAKKLGQPSHLGFSVGIFANLGVPALAASEKSYHSIASSVAGSTLQLHDAEQATLGCSHPEAGYCLLTDYNFQEAISTVAAGHCTDSSATLIAATHLAESFAHQLGFDGGFAIIPPAFDDSAFAKFGGTDSDTARMVEEITRWNSLAAKMLA